MAAETEHQASSPAPAPHIVGNAFVQQYYILLHQKPEEMHRFYMEDSTVGRPGLDGAMQSVKSLKAINDQILSFDIRNAEVQILTADSQGSHKDGVLVLVTGFLTGKDCLKRKFSQTFFLVPENQYQKYYVLNDVFRYIDEGPATSVADEANESVSVAPLTPDVSEPPSETAEQAEAPADAVACQNTETPPAEEADNVKESAHPVCNGNVTHSERDVAVTENSVNQFTEATSASETTDAAKKSFASIVQSLAENAAPFHLRVSPVKPRRAEQPRATVVSKVPEQAPVSDLSEKTADPAADGASIFVANLPMNATPEQLHETFKEFGSIKPDGIQVRSYKQRGNCFGFVAFESADAVKNVLLAVQAAPIKIGERKVSIEEKRANESGRPSGRSGRFRNDNGFRNDGFRGQRSFNGGRNSSRNRYEKRTDSQNGDANQQAYQNGGRRPPRQVQAGN